MRAIKAESVLLSGACCARIGVAEKSAPHVRRARTDDATRDGPGFSTSTREQVAAEFDRDDVVEGGIEFSVDVHCPERNGVRIELVSRCGPGEGALDARRSIGGDRR
jgi:hypothetical protein